MRLLDLDPSFLKIASEDYRTYQQVSTLAEADGIVFVCPQCVKKLGGRPGAHSIICWRPSVPQREGLTGPGRWQFEGNDLVDLTFVAGSSSVLVGGGCQAHFWIRNGEIVFA